MKRTLEFALSPAVRTQDTGTLIGSMMVQPWSQEMTWEFVKTNWQTMVKSLGVFQGIPSIVESTASFCSAPRAQEVRGFFEKNPMPRRSGPCSRRSSGSKTAWRSRSARASRSLRGSLRSRRMQFAVRQFTVHARDCLTWNRELRLLGKRRRRLVLIPLALE